MIETERLCLRPYSMSDLEACVAILGDPATMAFYPQPFTLDRIEAMIAKNIATYQNCGYGLFVMIEKTTEAVIGDCGITLQRIDGEERLEIGYRLSHTVWGRGYAPEAAAAVRDDGFARLDTEELCSYMGADHLQSRRVAEKIGMTLEKTYRNPVNRDLPTSVYRITRAEWEALAE